MLLFHLYVTNSCSLFKVFFQQTTIFFRQVIKISFNILGILLQLKHQYNPVAKNIFYKIFDTVTNRSFIRNYSCIYSLIFKTVKFVSPTMYGKVVLLQLSDKYQLTFETNIFRLHMLHSNLRGGLSAVVCSWYQSRPYTGA